MDNGLLHKGLIGLKPGEVLRLRNTAGRHLEVLQGIAWVTAATSTGIAPCCPYQAAAPAAMTISAPTHSHLTRRRRVPGMAAAAPRSM